MIAKYYFVSWKNIKLFNEDRIAIHNLLVSGRNQEDILDAFHIDIIQID